MDGLSDLVALKPAQLWAVVVLFLPGFISLKLHRFIERRIAGGAEDLIDVVGFSLLNGLVLWWPIYIAATHLALPKPDYGIVFQDAFWVCLVGPAVWPVVFQVIKRFGLQGGWLLGDQKAAFDAFFSTGQPCWVIVHLSDGRQIGGYYGSSSYASAHPHSGDFYLQELWSLHQGKFAEPIANSKGALFRRNDYVWLEFFWDGAPEPGSQNENPKVG